MILISAAFVSLADELIVKKIKKKEDGETMHSCFKSKFFVLVNPMQMYEEKLLI